MPKALKNFSIVKNGKFEEFTRVRILNNEEVYVGDGHRICVVDLDDIPEEPYAFEYPGLLYPIATTLEWLKSYVEKTPVFYLKKQEDGDGAVAATKETATHILRLPKETKIEDLVINGDNVLLIDRIAEVKKDGQ